MYEWFKRGVFSIEVWKRERSVTFKHKRRINQTPRERGIRNTQGSKSKQKHAAEHEQQNFSKFNFSSWEESSGVRWSVTAEVNIPSILCAEFVEYFVLRCIVFLEYFSVRVGCRNVLFFKHLALFSLKIYLSLAAVRSK